MANCEIRYQGTGFELEEKGYDFIKNEVGITEEV